MKKYKNIIIIALITIIILLLPLIAMQFMGGVVWSFFDFALAFIILFGIGLTYNLISQRNNNVVYKTALIIAITTTLILFWINGAVGIIGSENNPANLMYLGVIAIMITGSIISRFKPYGMTRTLFLAALAQILVPIIALIIWKPQITLGVLGVFILNGFFVLMFIISAFLFKQLINKQK